MAVESESSGGRRTAAGRLTAGATGQSGQAVDGLLVRAVRPAGAESAKHRATRGMATPVFFPLLLAARGCRARAAEGRGHITHMSAERCVQRRVAHRARRASCRSFGQTHLSSRRLSDVALPPLPFAFETLDMADGDGVGETVAAARRRSLRLRRERYLRACGAR